MDKAGEIKPKTPEETIAWLRKENDRLMKLNADLDLKNSKLRSTKAKYEAMLVEAGLL